MKSAPSLIQESQHPYNLIYRRPRVLRGRRHWLRLSSQQCHPVFHGLQLPKSRGLRLKCHPGRSQRAVRLNKDQHRQHLKPVMSLTETLQHLGAPAPIVVDRRHQYGRHPQTLQHSGSQAPLAVDQRYQSYQIHPGVQVHQDPSSAPLVSQHCLRKVRWVKKASLKSACYHTRSWLYKEQRSQNLHRPRLHLHLHLPLPLPLHLVHLRRSLEDKAQGLLIKISLGRRL